MPHLYILLFFWGWAGTAIHPFFISLTEIRQNPKNQQLEIAQKVFWDDLEVEMSEYFDQSIDILEPEDPEKLAQQIEIYALAHNVISIQKETVTLTFLGYEIYEDALWWYMQSEKVAPLEAIEVKNTLLLESFDSQQNIVHVYFPGFSSPRSLLLGRGEESGKLEKK